jgi:hypothetical protein
MNDYGEEADNHMYNENAFGNGLGSLADELAEEEWDEDAEGEQVYADSHGARGVEGNHEALPGVADESHKAVSGFPPAAASQGSTNGRHGQMRNRASPTDYDGSDYGDSDDLKEIKGISASLEEKMSAIESLARQGTGTITIASRKDLKSQDASALGDLGSQYNVESHITRLVKDIPLESITNLGHRLSTAYNALTTNLAHQSRTIASLSHPLSSPFSTPPDAELVDELIPLLETLYITLPHPPTSPLPSIHALRTNSDDLIETLRTLNDSLHMMRQTTNVASRKLREARENTAIFRKELDEVEESKAWLEKENRHQKLQQREAAAVCKEVVGGFEEFCEGWRNRLLNSGSSGSSVELMAG